jgi:hypothetical protein
LELYYEYTRILLEPVLCKVNYLREQSAHFSDVKTAIDSVYNDIVVSLRDASDLYIPKFARNYFKFWWNEELDVLKSAAMMSCNVWKAAGRPRHGELYLKYQSDKLQYKCRLREAQNQYDAESGRLENLKSKDQRHNVIEVNGYADSTVINENFSRHFERICSPSNPTRNDECKVRNSRSKENYKED